MSSSTQNVQCIERAISIAAGVAAIASGVYRGGPSGILKALGGAALLQRGTSGHCSIKGLITDPEAELAYLRQRVADLRAALHRIEEKMVSNKQPEESRAESAAEKPFPSNNIPTSL
jgi:hypothetical protein